MIIKHVVKRAARRFGYDIVNYGRERRGILKGDLAPLGIDVVFDVGANVGQYARGLRERGYRGEIVSFEPLTTAHATLTAAAAADPLWSVAERCALGAEAGEVEINVAENSYASSILPMAAAVTDAAPSARYVASESTPLIPLHTVFDQFKAASGRNYLKIDTQGFEAEVLKGAEAVFDQIVAVELELSTTPLYNGQRLFPHFVDYFAARGFTMWDVQRDFTDPKTLRMLQFDAVFVRDAVVAALGNAE